jgi:uncharacterized protein (TIGR02246 family)
VDRSALIRIVLSGHRSILAGREKYHVAVPMLSRLVGSSCLSVVLLACPMAAAAGPREDALAVFDDFLAGMTAADLERVSGLFTPDALVWGTTMRDLATTPEAVRLYFSTLKNFAPNQRKAAAVPPVATLVLSETAVLVSGMWGYAQQVDGESVVRTPARVSATVVKRGDRWLIAQFHNSVRPAPAAAPPAPTAQTPR